MASPAKFAYNEKTQIFLQYLQICRCITLQKKTFSYYRVAQKKKTRKGKGERGEGFFFSGLPCIKVDIVLICSQKTLLPAAFRENGAFTKRAYIPFYLKRISPLANRVFGKRFQLSAFSAFFLHSRDNFNLRRFSWETNDDGFV